jgi:putative flippase GtrA
MAECGYPDGKGQSEDEKARHQGAVPASGQGPVPIPVGRHPEEGRGVMGLGTPGLLAWAAVPGTSLIDFARVQFGRKPVRYSMVSVVAVLIGQTTLLICTLGLDMRPVPANVVAVSVGSVPSYMLNRIWVWGRRGNHQFLREVLPFWLMAFLGLAFSTLLVHFASLWSGAALVTNVANLTAFGSLWVVKYLVLDSLMFGHGHHSVDEPVLV